MEIVKSIQRNIISLLCPLTPTISSSLAFSATDIDTGKNQLMAYNPGEYSLEDDEDEYPSDPNNFPDDDGNDNDDEENDEENEEDKEEEKERKNPERHTPMHLLFGMMFNPIEGWKEIRRSKLSPDAVARGCFYLICAFTAISCFAGLIWDAAATISSCMVNGVKIFMTLFFGNFLALLMLKIGLPKKYNYIAESDFGKSFVMYNLSTLGLFYILYELFPPIGPALVFLPLWTIFLIMRGCRFFRFPQDKGNLLTTLICMYLLGAPIAVYWAFDILL